jgi:hypothetical protein
LGTLDFNVNIQHGGCFSFRDLIFPSKIYITSGVFNRLSFFSLLYTLYTALPVAQGRHLPSPKPYWLVAERRKNGEIRYYVSNLPAKATLLRLARQIKGRWVCEPAHQQLKQELGLDHFEGRSWAGLHHHVVLTLIAFAFLQYRRLAGKKSRSSLGLRLSPACPLLGVN